MEFRMSKLYTVISNDYVEHYNIKVGDICLLQNDDEDGSAWFYNESWDDDGTWCLDWSMVEEFSETN